MRPIRMPLVCAVLFLLTGCVSLRSTTGREVIVALCVPSTSYDTPDGWNMPLSLYCYNSADRPICIEDYTVVRCLWAPPGLLPCNGVKVLHHTLFSRGKWRVLDSGKRLLQEMGTCPTPSMQIHSGKVVLLAQNVMLIQLELKLPRRRTLEEWKKGQFRIWMTFGHFEDGSYGTQTCDGILPGHRLLGGREQKGADP